MSPFKLSTNKQPPANIASGAVVKESDRYETLNAKKLGQEEAAKFERVHKPKVILGENRSAQTEVVFQ